MKKLINLIFIISSAFCFAQEPPAKFKIKYSSLEVDSTLVLNQYKIDTPSLEFYRKEKNYSLAEETWNFFKDYLSKDSKFIFLYMGNPFPRKNDIIILIISKMDKAKMAIFIKTSFDLDFNENLYLKNLKFVEGYYYIDLPELIKKGNNTILNKYEIGPDVYGAYHTFEKELDLSNIKKYKISKKKLAEKIQ